MSIKVTKLSFGVAAYFVYWTFGDLIRLHVVRNKTFKNAIICLLEEFEVCYKTFNVKKKRNFNAFQVNRIFTFLCFLCWKNTPSIHK